MILFELVSNKISTYTYILHERDAAPLLAICCFSKCDHYTTNTASGNRLECSLATL